MNGEMLRERPRVRQIASTRAKPEGCRDQGIAREKVPVYKASPKTCNRGGSRRQSRPTNTGEQLLHGVRVGNEGSMESGKKKREV